MAIRFICGLSVALLLATAVFAQDDQVSVEQVLRLQVAQLQQQLAAVNMTLEVCRVEVAHPGYRLDPQKGLVKR